MSQSHWMYAQEEPSWLYVEESLEWTLSQFRNIGDIFVTLDVSWCISTGFFFFFFGWIEVAQWNIHDRSAWPFHRRPRILTIACAVISDLAILWWVKMINHASTPSSFIPSATAFSYRSAGGDMEQMRHIRKIGLSHEEMSWLNEVAPWNTWDLRKFSKRKCSDWRERLVTLDVNQEEGSDLLERKTYILNLEHVMWDKPGATGALQDLSH